MSEPAGSEATAPPPPKSLHLIGSLVGVAAASGILIVLVYQWTLPVIKAKQAEALRRAVFEVIPGARTVVTFRLAPDGTVAPLEEQDERAVKYYAGYTAAGRLVGVAIEAQGQGYQDVIKVLYGYDPFRERIVGMKVLESKETPGLGDKIGKDPAFLANFSDLEAGLTENRRALRHAFEVVKQGTKAEPWQIDAITGATVSSKAVGKMLNANAPRRLPPVRSNLQRFEKGQ